MSSKHACRKPLGGMRDTGRTCVRGVIHRQRCSEEGKAPGRQPLILDDSGAGAGDGVGAA